jgi:hypothetical protein
MAEVTITDTIDDDIRSLLAEKLGREEFLGRFAEQFFYIVANPRYRDGNFEVILITAPGEEGMFLPVFTAEERCADLNDMYIYSKFVADTFDY